MIDETLKHPFTFEKKNEEQNTRKSPTSYSNLSRNELEKRLAKAEQENINLKRQKQLFHHFRVIAEHTSTSVVIVNPEGIAEWVNRSFERLTGRHFSEIVGQKPGQFLMGEDTDLATLQNVINMMQLEQSFTYEVQHYNSQGTPFQIIVNGEPILDNNGKLLGYAMLETDVTLLKVMERSLVDAQQAAQESEAAKDNFLSNVSHELRTPLNGIIGLSQLLSTTPLSFEQAEYVKTIRGSGEALSAMISKLLALTEVSTKQVECEKANIRAKLTKGVEKLRPECEARNIRLNLQIDSSVPDVLCLKWAKLCDALAHLIDNAVKFTPAGKVDLIVCHQKTRYLQFIVRDTGIGIRDEALPHIFDEFYQADSSHTRKYQGAGLGLPIAKKLIESLGSQIKVETVPDHGSSFSFVIPY